MSGSCREVCVKELSLFLPKSLLNRPLPQSGPDLGENCILAGRVPRRAGTVFHGKAAVDVQPRHEAGLAAF